MCGDKPCIQADRKTVSMLHFSLGTEGRRFICSRKPNLKMDIITTVELWKIMEDTFIRPCNITFDRYMLLTAKQSKGESIEHFFGKLRVIAILEIKKIPQSEISSLPICRTLKFRELQRKTIEPAQELRLAIEMELGQRNQLYNSNTQPKSHVTPQRPFRQSNQRQNFTAPIRQTNQLCRNCGLTRSVDHKGRIIAKGKTCNNCGLFTEPLFAYMS